MLGESADPDGEGHSMKSMASDKATPEHGSEGTDESPGIGRMESIGLALLFLGVILVRPLFAAWSWLQP